MKIRESHSVLHKLDRPSRSGGAARCHRGAVVLGLVRPILCVSSSASRVFYFATVWTRAPLKYATSFKLKELDDQFNPIDLQIYRLFRSCGKAELTREHGFFRVLFPSFANRTRSPALEAVRAPIDVRVGADGSCSCSWYAR